MCALISAPSLSRYESPVRLTPCPCRSCSRADATACLATAAWSAEAGRAGGMTSVGDGLVVGAALLGPAIGLQALRSTAATMNTRFMIFLLLYSAEGTRSLRIPSRVVRVTDN